MNLSRRAVIAGLFTLPLAAASIASTPDTARADTADQLAAASAQLESLGAELSAMQASLADATSELEETDYQIEEKAAQIEEQRIVLEEKQTQLGGLMKASYKSGGTSMLDFVLSSASFEELVTRVYYLDSISESEAAAISEVRTLAEKLEQDKLDLEDKKADQQVQVESLQSQVGDYQARVAEAQEVYNSLDAQLQAELEAQRNAEIQAALDAAELQNQQDQNQSQGEQNQNQGQDQTPQLPETPQEPEQQPETPPSQGSGGHTPSGGGVATALAQVGKPYVLGTAGPDTFDCSGLVCYSYGYARGRTTYQMINSLKSTGDWKTSMSQLNYGDLIFTSSGHVGIYLGGGQLVHAATPAVGVVVANVWAFYGGGPY